MATVKNILKRKSKEAYIVTPSQLEFDASENERLENNYSDSPEDWESFKNSIKENGQLEPIYIYRHPDKEDKFKIHHGFRRAKAIIELIKEGAEIEGIMAYYENKSDETTRIFEHVLRNTGRPLTPLEKAFSMTKLFDRGLTEEEISKKLGVTLQIVKEMIFVVKNADSALLKKIMDGDIAFWPAFHTLKISKKSGQSSDEIIKKAKDSNGGKVTEKAIKNTAKPESKPEPDPEADPSAKPSKGYNAYEFEDRFDAFIKVAEKSKKLDIALKLKRVKKFLTEDITVEEAFDKFMGN